jgi:hypothetical protein
MSYGTSAAQTAAAAEAGYIPQPGHEVRVRRYQVPCPELPGVAERKMIAEHAGTVGKVRKVPGGVLFQLVGFGHDICTADQFSGQDPEHGCSWSLHTEVVPLAETDAHDRAQLAARAQQAENERARAAELWERSRDAEAVARQRLIGAQERLEAAMRKAASAGAVPAPRTLDTPRHDEETHRDA